MPVSMLSIGPALDEIGGRLPFGPGTSGVGSVPSIGPSPDNVGSTFPPGPSSVGSIPPVGPGPEGVGRPPTGPEFDSVGSTFPPGPSSVESISPIGPGPKSVGLTAFPDVAELIGLGAGVCEASTPLSPPPRILGTDKGSPKGDKFKIGEFEAVAGSPPTASDTDKGPRSIIGDPPDGRGVIAGGVRVSVVCEA